jgi:hypothetical protein
MAELKEVFEMVTKQSEPDLDSWKQQESRQRRASRNRKIGAFAVAAAIAIVAAIVAANIIPADRSRVPLGQPSSSTTAPGAAAPAGTVTFDGSTCSMEITADRIEPGFAGFVAFEVVNATEQRVMFDSWQLLDGYIFQAFETAVERSRRIVESGKPYPTPGPFPDQETEVRYLKSDVIPANSSKIIVARMSPGTHAIACLQRFEGAHRSLRGFQPFGVAGPIVVR